eukprot:746460-Hanusia_phi.AAC.1
MASLRDQGNAAFKSGNFEEAVRLYSSAIEEDKENEVLYSNRSASLLALNRIDEARRDAEKCIELKPDWAKGHYRRSRVHEKMKEFQLAAVCMAKALELDPSNQEVQKRLKTLQALAKPAGPPKDNWNLEEILENLRESGFSGAEKNADEALQQDLDPRAWAKGLSPKEQRTWLVDCYRMRADDDYVWGGCNMHGLYHMSGKQPIVEDFLVFCKLAVERQVIPAEWDWKKFLATAKDLLPYAFEKEDAKDKYGGENVLTAAMGGRSLRFTAEVIYQSSCMSGDMGISDRHSEVSELVDCEWKALSKPAKASFFDDVGGQKIWVDLFRTMHNCPSAA